MDPSSFAHLMALHDDMLQLERSRRGAADGVSKDMPSDVLPAPAEPIVDHTPPPPPRPRRRKKVEDPIIDLGKV